MQVRDEVCGMEFPIERAQSSVVLNGRTFHFCSDGCREHFLAHPEWYVPANPEADQSPS